MSAIATEPGDGQGWLSRADVAALFSPGRTRTFTRGQPLMHQHQLFNDVFLIRSGRVKVCVIEDGVEGLLAVRFPGDIVGEQSALDGRPRSASVVALEAVRATVVTGRAFEDFLEVTPSANRAIRRELSRRLREAAEKRGEFGRLDAMGRLASRLLELAMYEEQKNECVLSVSVPLSHEELAAWIGASVPSVERAFKDMRKLGWIERTGRRGIRILDPEQVRRRTM